MSTDSRGRRPETPPRLFGPAGGPLARRERGARGSQFLDHRRDREVGPQRGDLPRPDFVEHRVRHAYLGPRRFNAGELPDGLPAKTASNAADPSPHTMPPSSGEASNSCVWKAMMKSRTASRPLMTSPVSMVVHRTSS